MCVESLVRKGSSWLVAVVHCSRDQHCCPRLMTAFPAIYPTKFGDSSWRSCMLMSSTAYPKFSLIAHPSQTGSCSHRPLLPILDLTSTCLGKSIHVPINSLSFWMHLSYHNVFPDISYIFPQTISQDPSRCAQERMWHADCHWTSLPCYHHMISHTVDYTSLPSCVHHVTR
jgi:hypothetical protein